MFHSHFTGLNGMALLGASIVLVIAHVPFTRFKVPEQSLGSLHILETVRLYMLGHPVSISKIIVLGCD